MKTIQCKYIPCPFCNCAEESCLDKEYEQVGRAMVRRELMACNRCDGVWEQFGNDLILFDDKTLHDVKKISSYLSHTSERLSGIVVIIEESEP